MKKCITLAFTLLVSSLLLISCDFDSDEAGKKPPAIDTTHKDSTNKKIIKKNYWHSDSLNRDTSLQGRIVYAISSLPEVKNKIKAIDSSSAGKQKAEVVFNQKPLENEQFYNVQLISKGQNGTQVVYDFYVNHLNKEIKVYDPGEDRLISIDEWREINF